MPIEGMNTALVSENTYKLLLKHTASSNPVTATDKMEGLEAKERLSLSKLA